MTFGLLPNNALPPTTETTAFFNIAGGRCAKWLIAELSRDGSVWLQSASPAVNCAEVLEQLRERSNVGVNRYILLSQSGWTAVLNDAKLGTDLGMIPSLAARKLSCVAIRAVAIEDSAESYGATILEVYDPAADPPLKCSRAISAANDGGTWKFSEFGRRFGFESSDAYCQRRIRDRFTPVMLHTYLRHLNVPEFSSRALENYSVSVVERAKLVRH